MEDIFIKVTIGIIIFIGAICIIAVLKKAVEAVQREEKKEQAQLQEMLSKINGSSDVDWLYGVMRNSSDEAEATACELRLTTLADNGNDYAQLRLGIKYTSDYINSNLQDQDSVDNAYEYLTEAASSSNEKIANEANVTLNRMEKVWQFNPGCVKPTKM